MAELDQRNAEAIRCQCRHQLPNLLVRNALRTMSARRHSCLRRSLGRIWVAERQKDCHGGAVGIAINAARNLDPAAVPLHKLLRNEQSDSSAAAPGPCGEECLEDFWQLLRWNSHAIVRD